MTINLDKLKQDLQAYHGGGDAPTPFHDYGSDDAMFDGTISDVTVNATTGVDKGSSKSSTSVSIGTDMNGNIISADMLKNSPSVSNSYMLQPQHKNFLWWVWFDKNLIQETEGFDVKESDFERVRDIVKYSKYYDEQDKVLLNRLRDELKELYLHVWKHLYEGDWIWISQRPCRIERVTHDMNSGQPKAMYKWHDKEVWFDANCEETVQNKLYYEEITKHLKKVAEFEKGFDVGKRFELHEDKPRGVVPMDNFNVDTYYDVRSDTFYYHSAKIFEKGKWAKIV